MVWPKKQKKNGKDSLPIFKDCAVSWQHLAVNSLKSPSAFRPRSYSAWGGPNQWLSKIVEQKTGNFHPMQNSSNGQSLLWSSPLQWLSCWQICIVVWWRPASFFFLSQMLLLNKPPALLTSSQFLPPSRPNWYICIWNCFAGHQLIF